MTSPIFIVGANRSGTTLLRLLLNAHPRIAIPEELVYLDSSLAGTPVEAWRDPALSPAAYQRFVEAFLDDNPSLFETISRPALRRRILGGPARDLRHPYATTLQAWAEAQNKPRWGEKTPGNLFFVDVLMEMFPQAQFIYVVRDPRAGVASMQKVSFFPDDVVPNALIRRKFATEGFSLLTRSVPSSQWTTVRYEDLVTHPEQVLRSVCGFLGEAYVPSMLAFHHDAQQFMAEEASTSFNAAATRPISASRIEAWRARLTNAEVAIIEAICAEEMTRHHYRPDAGPLSTRQWLRVQAWQLYWAAECWRNRHIRQYTVKYPPFARLRSRFDWWFRAGRRTSVPAGPSARP
jgi:hypothetical protein